MTKKKKEYLTPQLTVVQFKVERGYAASSVDVNLVNNMVEATNRFIEDRQYESELWNDSRYGTASIEDRKNGTSLATNEDWLSNNGGEYF